MIFVLRKRRGVVKRKWKVGTFDSIGIQIGLEEATFHSGVYVWVPWLEFVISL